ncbi:hypothetical protein CEXT_596481 [Caerostris extrusa]|uniref:Uncharacterized protein n=1 Tax=Caerostris extrusa TaxID=172846 RepID=A0AAV4MKE3_CAEEX|nr:hypothetical protein CEXT_596481 [Caerostris extrusa]
MGGSLILDPHTLIIIYPITKDLFFTHIVILYHTLSSKDLLVWYPPPILMNPKERFPGLTLQIYCISMSSYRFAELLFTSPVQILGMIFSSFLPVSLANLST